MVHSTTTIREQLRALIRLQHIDNCIDSLQKERGNLPEEIVDLEDDIEGLRTRIRNSESEKKTLATRRKRWEIDIKDAEMLIKRYEDQQPQVRNNREYDALTKEIDTQQARIAEATLAMESTEGLDDELTFRVTEAQESLKEREVDIEEKRIQLREVSAATEQKLAEWNTLRIQALERVDARYRRAYDRLRKRLRDGRAVVKLERGAAGGFAVPPQRQVEIRQGNRIIACEHTGRIIVDPKMYAGSISDLEWSDSKSLVDRITELVEGRQQERSWTVGE